MSRAGLTRRVAMAAALLAPSAVWARPRAGVYVDVSQLRRDGDNTDADYFERVMPGYIQAALPGRRVSARIDSVSYGPPGSAGGNVDGAVDTIEGVGIVDGHEIPITATHVVTTMFPDPTGYAAHERQDVLARSFAQWLGRPAAF
jgi:hypothetical protein